MAAQSRIAMKGWEKINIWEKAIHCVHPLIPVDNLAFSQDQILQKKMILFRLNIWSNGKR